MSIFTYHLAKTSYAAALGAMWSPPKPGKIHGLIHAECMFSMTLGAPIFSPSRILARQVALFAQWDNDAAIDQFLKQDPLGVILAKGWHVRLLLTRQWGTFSGFKIDSTVLTSNQGDAPVVAVTIARMKLPEVPRFIHWGRPVELLVRDHPGVILASASIRFPRTVSTFSIWKSSREMTEMVQGRSVVHQPQRHSDAMRERERRDFHHEFTTLRFRPVAEVGEWDGRAHIIPNLK